MLSAPGVLLASVTALRSEPVPLSARLVTVKAVRSCRHSSISTCTAVLKTDRRRRIRLAPPLFAEGVLSAAQSVFMECIGVGGFLVEGATGCNEPPLVM